MAEMDIRQAHRNIPVHPHDWPLLGMHWQGDVFADATLPFGLRSAPLIFSVIADAAQWVMERKSVQWVAHYVDNLITIGVPGSKDCASNVLLMHSLCEQLGLPVEPEKDEGPTTTLSFLGIELDSNAMEVRLPEQKLIRLHKLLISWRSHKACKKRGLLSPIGLLPHACKVVRSGRSFLRRLIDLSMVSKHLDHYLCLNVEARSDIEWWARYSQTWNGISMMHLPNESTPVAVLTSDASGRWGCGAYSGANWFMLQCVDVIVHYHITVKEMIIACALWGPAC